MKKRLLVAMAVTGLMISSIATGCGKKETPEATPVSVEAAESSEEVTETAEETTAEETTAEETTAEETTVEETTAAEERAEAELSSDYLSWTGKDWNSAGDEEKENASRVYLVESVKATAKATGQEYTAEMEAAITPDMVSANVAVLDAAFAADESMSLQDLLDMTVEAANAMMDAAATMQQTQ